VVSGTARKLSGLWARLIPLSSAISMPYPTHWSCVYSSLGTRMSVNRWSNLRRFTFGTRALLHTLLGIGDRPQLEGHPVVGGSWEGFVIEQLLVGLPKANAYYW
jgi:hypothetical protein